MNINHVGYRIHRDSGTVILVTDKGSSNYKGYLIRLKKDSDSEHDVGDYASNWVSTFEKYSKTKITEEELELVTEIVNTKVDTEYLIQMGRVLSIKVDSPITENDGVVNIKGKACFKISDVYSMFQEEGKAHILMKDSRELCFSFSEGFSELLDIYTKYNTEDKPNKTIVK